MYHYSERRNKIIDDWHIAAFVMRQKAEKTAGNNSVCRRVSFVDEEN